MIKTLRTAMIAVLASIGSLAAQGTEHDSAAAGFVYTMSNSAAGNQVAVIERSRSGSLRLADTYATGGKGSGPGEFGAIDPFGSQSALLLSRDGRWLFGTNAGSNQVFAFRVLKRGLRLTSVVDSGGFYPVSIALKGDEVYVLNSGNDGTIVGFRLSRQGRLQPIRGSSRSLHSPTPNVDKQPHVLFNPAQIEFTPDRQWLVVTDKEPVVTGGAIRLFKVRRDGLLAQTPVTTGSPDPFPWGFTFDRFGHLLVTETGFGALSSYDINDDGTLTPISLSVFTGQLETCWIDMSGKFAYASNTPSSNISGYAVARDGTLTLLDPTGISATVGSGALDVAVSTDDRFLHVLSGGTGEVTAFRINQRTGALTQTGVVSVFAAESGIVGLTAD